MLIFAETRILLFTDLTHLNGMSNPLDTVRIDLLKAERKGTTGSEFDLTVDILDTESNMKKRTDNWSQDKAQIAIDFGGSDSVLKQDEPQPVDFAPLSIGEYFDIDLTDSSQTKKGGKVIVSETLYPPPGTVNGTNTNSVDTDIQTLKLQSTVSESIYDLTLNLTSGNEPVKLQFVKNYIGPDVDVIAAIRNSSVSEPTLTIDFNSSKVHPDGVAIFVVNENEIVDGRINKDIKHGVVKMGE